MSEELENTLNEEVTLSEEPDNPEIKYFSGSNLQYLLTKLTEKIIEHHTGE